MCAYIPSIGAIGHKLFNFFVPDKGFAKQHHEYSTTILSLAKVSKPDAYHSVPTPTASNGDVTPLFHSISQKSIVQSRCALENLPHELILEISKHLPPVSLFAWSYTCRTFLRIVDTSLLCRQLRACLRYLDHKNTDYRISDKSFEESPMYQTTLNQRMQLLCLLESDNFLSPGKAVCSTCTSVHEKCMFSSRELKTTSKERKCLGTSGRFWMCPHASLAHELIRDHRPSKAFPRPTGVCKECPIEVLVLSCHVYSRFPILDLTPFSEARNELASEKVAELDLRICPHRRLGDAVLPDLRAADCSLMLSNAFSRKVCDPAICSSCATCNRSGPCPSCNSRIRFFTDTNASGKCTLWVHIERVCGFGGRLSRDWLSRIFQPEEYEAWERAWLQTIQLADGVLRDLRTAAISACGSYLARRTPDLT